MIIVRNITAQERREAKIRHASDRHRDFSKLKVAQKAELKTAELKEGGICHSAEKKEPSLKQIKAATKRSNSLIKEVLLATSLLNNALLLSMIDAGKAVFQPVPLNVSALCSEIVEDLQITTERHQLILRSQVTTPNLTIDEKQIDYILTNLLLNAISASPNGSDIIISILEHACEIEIQVKNADIGTPIEHQDTQANPLALNSDVSSTLEAGLSLEIIKKAVDLHQGRIDHRSHTDGDISYTVYLPIHSQTHHKTIDATIGPKCSES